MNRIPNWPEALIEYLEARRPQPFAWGSNDCGLFAADGVIAQTGVDPVPQLRGYSDERGALIAIREAGGMEAIAIGAGLVEKPVAFLQRGEVVIADMHGRDTYGLVGGNGFWAGPGEFELEWRPMSEVRKGYGF